MQGTTGVMGIILLAALIGLYFIPSIVAFSRNHHNAAGIFLLNLFLGWTVIGWIAALIWSVTAIQPSQTITTIKTSPQPTRESQLPPQPNPPQGRNYCSKCGKAVKAVDIYCSSCGANLSQ
jgi:hypothetical protein